MLVQHKKVVDRDGTVLEVKSTKNNTIMLCGEWMCLEMSFHDYHLALSRGRFTVI